MGLDGGGGSGDDGDRAVILNPKSGSGQHGETVRDLAADRGFAVLETQAAGDAIDLAERAAADGVDLLAAAGGDGTVNEVVRGLDAADALDRVTLGVVPGGTGNNFADNVGVRDIEHAFEVLDGGERRRVDVGTADGRPFVNSCVGGLTADASASTSAELKERFGVLAYVISTLRAVTEFDAPPLAVTASADEETTWSGEAVFVLVGNGRRFPARGRTQADMEDGRLNVTIIEQMPPTDLLEETTVYRLFGREMSHVTHLTTPELHITVDGGEPVDFSLDGEVASRRTLSLGVRPRTLELCVGGDYEPDPEE